MGSRLAYLKGERSQQLRLRLKAALGALRSAPFECCARICINLDYCKP
jgi:hypothetical protein